MTTVLRTVAIDDLVLALTPALGPDAAREKLTVELESLGLPPAGRLPREDAIKVLEQVHRRGGVLGMAAGQAVRRLHTGGRLSGTMAPVSPEAERVVSRKELVDHLASAVGREVAEAAVGLHAERLGFPDRGPARLALAVLEAIAREPGPAAASAAFAKARLRLR